MLKNVVYELNELVRLSFEEGISPVLLTVRFLRNLTQHAFTYYLGAKVQFDNQNTDLDLLACCDGSLVTGECKSLPSVTSQVKWNEIKEQLIPAIEVAKKCNFHIFFVSSFTDNYPRKFKADLKKLAGTSLNLLFITKKNLEEGFSEVKDHKGETRELNMYSLLNPEEKRKRKKKA